MALIADERKRKKIVKKINDGDIIGQHRLRLRLQPRVYNGICRERLSRGIVQRLNTARTLLLMTLLSHVGLKRHFLSLAQSKCK